MHRALCAPSLEGNTGGSPHAARLEPVAEQLGSRAASDGGRARRDTRGGQDTFMQEHVGSTFDGIGRRRRPQRLWVELDEAFVEGFIPVARLTEYYDFVCERMELQSRRRAA